MTSGVVVVRVGEGVSCGKRRAFTAVVCGARSDATARTRTSSLHRAVCRLLGHRMINLPAPR